MIAILASANALAHSYAGLYDWAIHHRLTGWQAMSWPAEIDVFLAVGELALYVAYLDTWPARQRISQRTLARELRGQGHHFPNDHLRQIAQTIGLAAHAAA